MQPAISHFTDPVIMGHTKQEQVETKREMKRGRARVYYTNMKTHK